MQYSVRYQIRRVDGEVFCKKCNHNISAVHPEPNYSEYCAQNKYSSYWDDHRKFEKYVFDHALGCSVQECEHCRRVVSKSGMKAHQKSMSCMLQQRQGELKAAGLQDVRWNLKEFEMLAEAMLNRLIQDLPWNEGVIRAQAIRDYEESLLKFKELCEIQNFLAGFGSRGRSLKWCEVPYAPAYKAFALDNISKTVKSEDDYDKFAAIWNFLHASYEQQQAIVGLLELAQESET